MQLNLEGQRVLITGGTRGIGLGCAVAFCKEGAEVTIVGSSPDSTSRALEHINEMGMSVAGLSFKLDQRADQLALAGHLENIDILVNNAGAIPGGGLEALTDDAWRRAWDLKVHGYIETTRIALPIMESRKRGVIINIIGIAGAMPRYDYICGSTGNAALIAFTQAVGAYSTKQRVRVLGVNPGVTETDRVMTLYKGRSQQRFGDESRWEELLQNLPFGRPAKAEEIANLVVYLSSDRASYLSGTVIDADGGARHLNV